MKAKTIGILGLGRFGRTVALELSQYGHEVIAIDNDPKKVHAVSDQVTYTVVGDFTDRDLLEEVGLANCEAVIIASGSNLESAILAIVHCKKLAIPKIIAKSRGLIYEEVLYDIGATTVISPERSAGIQLASRLMKNRIEEVIQLDGDTSIIEFKTPESWVNQSLKDLDLRKKYDLNIIGIRPGFGKIMTHLNPNTLLDQDMILVAVASHHTFEKYDYLGYFN